MVVRKRRRIFLFLLLMVLFTFKGQIFSIMRTIYLSIFMEYEHPQQVLKERKLLQLHAVFKHGHRAPFRVYEPNKDIHKDWPEGLGNLTKLGRFQMYLIGKHLRERYKDFLTSNPDEIHVQTSFSYRSQYSAYSFAAGMYPPSAEWAISEGLLWQPIPVHYVQQRFDMYLQSISNCPVYEAVKDAKHDSPEENGYVIQYKELFNSANEKLGTSFNRISHMADLHKTYVMEKMMNYTIPNWILKYWDELSVISDLNYYINFGAKLAQRLRAGPILDLILTRMKQKIQDVDHTPKVYAYSGHGSNIAAILCALLQYDRHAPVGATLVFELYQEPRDFHSIRLLFFNSTQPHLVIEEPFIYRLHGCNKEYCPLEEFQTFVSDLIPDNWKEECEDVENLNFYCPQQRPQCITDHSSTFSSAWKVSPEVSIYLLIFIFYSIKFLL